ncbi:MAG: AbrB family transcriptional regulator, partial [Thauera sp.]|nr:AbrB family transcriptional regulator [Thauera sp.]
MSALSTLRLAAWRQILPTLALATLAGWLAERLHLPLPWMIGPLFAVAGARMADRDLRPLPGGRQTGQWAIGAALGLYFSPEVVAQLSLHAPLVIAAALGSLVLGMAYAFILLRLGGVDAPTAFFAALPGGASEMANLADRHGGAVDRIAAAHAIRVMMVVSVLPFALTFAGVQGSDVYVPLARDVDAQHFPLLVGASLLGVGAFKLLRIANAWVLGPLLGVALATLAGVPLSALPPWVVNGGQLLIGCAL